MVSSLLQAAGVAAISLFFTVLLGGKLPDVVEAFIEAQSFIVLGVVVFITAVSGTVSSGFATYYGIKISWEQYEKIAGRLLEQYLDNPYEWHITQNSASLINAVLNEARSVCTILQQWVMVLVRGVDIVVLTALLIVAKPMVALTAFSSFFIVYGALFKIKRGFILRQGKLLVKANEERQKTVAEALGGIKAVKVAQNAPYFQNRFERAAGDMVSATVNVQYFSVLPKYFIEALLFGALVGFVVLSKIRGWGVYESIPLLALYGAAALRMLPGAQQLYASLTTIVGNHAVVTKVANGLIDQGESLSTNGAQTGSIVSASSLIELSGVSYRYPQAARPSIERLDLKISTGEKIGLVGATGAGKTTLVDLMLGLLHPQEGTLSTAPTEGTHRRLVAYVPQQLHFLDDTIGANIAWGIPESERDIGLIEDAARRAKIHEHIATLSDGYHTVMGEGGVRLSGGQRQRIGIARALYLEPALLVLDEASNALDPETERQVLDTLFEQDLTLVVIAHRLSTLRKCDRILVMQGGKIISQGTFDHLVDTCSYFQRLSAADVGKTLVLD